MNDILEAILVIIYNLTILIGTVYLVQVYNWSGWWFFLSVCLLACTSKKKKCNCKEEPKSKIIIND